MEKEYEILLNGHKDEEIEMPYKVCFLDNMEKELPYNNKYFHDFFKLDNKNET